MAKFAATVSSVNMHFSHDKHQYFFEKFLRNEMKGEELLSFTKKLSENEKFKSDFDFYVDNRKEIVEEELAEYDEPELLKAKPQKWGWLYATISILCLVLIIDYYFSANYSVQTEAKPRRKPLIEKINIFEAKENVPEPIAPVKEKKVRKKSIIIPEVYPEDSNVLFEAAEAQLLLYKEGNRLAIQGDYFLADSLFKVLEASAIKKKEELLNIETDSLLDDSSITALVVKSLYRNVKSIPRQLLVEFWGSPIHFRGYLFNGKKLMLYGIDPKAPIYLSYGEVNNTYHLILRNKEYHLFPDNEFHKIVEE
ncbi:MAG: hypothetical protein K9I36_05770 [Bacteroidia bacterium]|nr:hypothetical protein [Bacteroidia bacterium]MCF8426219.1 hypothetical protein [Bacteroidia bacterium]